MLPTMLKRHLAWGYCKAKQECIFFPLQTSMNVHLQMVPAVNTHASTRINHSTACVGKDTPSGKTKRIVKVYNTT